jgi:hypothetical protein
LASGVSRFGKVDVRMRSHCGRIVIHSGSLPRFWRHIVLQWCYFNGVISMVLFQWCYFNGVISMVLYRSIDEIHDEIQIAGRLGMETANDSH